MTSPDIIVQEQFIGDDQALFAALATDVSWDERMRARKTTSYGRAYNYSGITYPEIPMHPLLVPVVDRLEAHSCRK